MDRRRRKVRARHGAAACAISSATGPQRPADLLPFSGRLGRRGGAGRRCSARARHDGRRRAHFHGAVPRVRARGSCVSAHDRVRGGDQGAVARRRGAMSLRLRHRPRWRVRAARFPPARCSASMRPGSTRNSGSRRCSARRAWPRFRCPTCTRTCSNTGHDGDRSGAAAARRQGGYAPHLCAEPRRDRALRDRPGRTLRDALDVVRRRNKRRTRSRRSRAQWRAAQRAPQGRWRIFVACAARSFSSISARCRPAKSGTAALVRAAVGDSDLMLSRGPTEGSERIVGHPAQPAVPSQRGGASRVSRSPSRSRRRTARKPWIARDQLRDRRTVEAHRCGRVWVRQRQTGRAGQGRGKES